MRNAQETTNRACKMAIALALGAILTGCVEKSKAPTFIEKGKTYNVGNGMIADFITIKEDKGNGWYLVQSRQHGGEVYFNMAQATIVIPQ